MALNSNYQEIDINLNQQAPLNKLKGKIPNYTSVSVRTLRVQLNPNSTQDFFASGEYVKKVSESNGLIVVDLVSAITDVSLGFLENSDMLIQKQDLQTKASVKVYNKGDIVNIISSFNSDVEYYAEAGAAITAGDALEVHVDGDKLQTLTTGKKVARALTSATTAGDSILVVSEKISN